MNYKDMLIEKTKIRTTDPKRYDAITMILDGASKKAKAEMREVTEDDLVSSVKTQMKNIEKAMELVKAHNGDITKHIEELNEYQKFLPRMLDALATNVLIVHLLEANEEKPGLLPIKKNMGKYMAMIKTLPEASQIDMTIASKALQNYLQ